MPWGDTTRWVDLKPHVFWELTRVKGDCTLYLEPYGLDATKDLTGRSDTRNGWSVRFDIPLRQLPIPEDSSAWILKSVVFENEPKSGEEVYTSLMATIVRTSRVSPIDTFLWAYNEDKLHGMDMHYKMLGHFPDSNLLLMDLITAYTEQRNCDSLRAVVGRWLYYGGYWEKTEEEREEMRKRRPIVEICYADPNYNRSPFFIDNLGADLSNVCGDSTFPKWEP